MKLVIVEDQPILREALGRVCVQYLGHEVVGDAGSVEEAVRVLLAQRPDAVILDVGLPDGSGLEVIERLRTEGLRLRVVILSGRIDPLTVHQVERAGIDAFVDKNSDPLVALQAALEAAAEGRRWFSPSYLAVRRTRIGYAGNFAAILSEAEQRVLAQVGEGLSDDEIAGRLGIRRTTAQTHRSHIMRKLGVSSTPKLMAWAWQHGFGESATRE